MRIGSPVYGQAYLWWYVDLFNLVQLSPRFRIWFARTYISLNWYNPPLASRTEFFHSLSIR